MEVVISRNSDHWQQLLEAEINIAGSLHEGSTGANTLGLACSGVLEIVTSGDVFLSPPYP